jgi:hypothetical protein
VNGLCLAYIVTNSNLFSCVLWICGSIPVALYCISLTLAYPIISLKRICGNSVNRSHWAASQWPCLMALLQLETAIAPAPPWLHYLDISIGTTVYSVIKVDELCKVLGEADTCSARQRIPYLLRNSRDLCLAYSGPPLDVCNNSEHSSLNTGCLLIPYMFFSLASLSIT